MNDIILWLADTKYIAVVEMYGETIFHATLAKPIDAIALSRIVTTIATYRGTDREFKAEFDDNGIKFQLKGNQ